MKVEATFTHKYAEQTFINSLHPGLIIFTAVRLQQVLQAPPNTIKPGKEKWSQKHIQAAYAALLTL